MAKHRAPRYVRTKKVLTKAPVAAGATVVGFGVLGSPSQALAGTTGPLPAHAVEAPAAAAVADAGAPEAGYTVERGDTIATIAAAHDQSWRDLYQRNVGVIGADPNLIFPGQVLHTAGSAAAAPAAPAPAAGSAGDAAPAPVVAPLAAAAAPAPVAAAAPAAAPAATARISNSSGDVASQVQAAADRVVSEVSGAGSITIGGTRASATDPNGHPSGLALDYMVMSDAALGDAIAEYHIAHWDELGVEYVIWQQRILTSPDGAWKAMADRGSATANHMDHVHVNYVG
jgi:LysM repeat protein